MRTLRSPIIACIPSRSDPFVDFSRREGAAFTNLSAAEKITLTSSRLVLANKFARTAVLIYVLVLHLLVVATLWHFGHVGHRGCGDHENHLFDGATLGPPIPADGATPRERLMETFHAVTIKRLCSCQ